MKINWPVPPARVDAVKRGLNERKETVPTTPETLTALSTPRASQQPNTYHTG